MRVSWWGGAHPRTLLGNHPAAKEARQLPVAESAKDGPGRANLGRDRANAHHSPRESRELTDPTRSSAASFRELGPPDLCHVIKTTGRAGQKDVSPVKVSEWLLPVLIRNDDARRSARITTSRESTPHHQHP